MTDEAARAARAPLSAAPEPAPPEPDPVLDARRRRALFRATHRGTKEADRLIGGWLAPRVGALDAAGLDAVERLLELPDPDLADWLYGRAPVPPEHDTGLLRELLLAARTPAPPPPRS